jgi:hypothetical protein
MNREALKMPVAQQWMIAAAVAAVKAVISRSRHDPPAYPRRRRAIAPKMAIGVQRRVRAQWEDTA